MYVSNSPNTPDVNFKQTKLPDNVQQTNNENQTKNTVFYSNLDDSKDLNANLQDNSIMTTLKNQVSCDMSLPKNNNNISSDYLIPFAKKLSTYMNIKDKVINLFKNISYKSQSQSSQNETDNYVQGQVKSQISNLNASLQRNYETEINNMQQQALQEFEHSQETEIQKEPENNQTKYNVDRSALLEQKQTDDNAHTFGINHGKVTANLNGTKFYAGADDKNVNLAIRRGNMYLGVNYKHTGTKPDGDSPTFEQKYVQATFGFTI